MMDKSRITLCMALLALFAFNPLSGFFDEDTNKEFSSSGESRPGRTILSTNSFMGSFTSFSPAGWIMNLGLHFILFLVVMVKIFIYGEVRVDMKSKGKKRLIIEDFLMI